MNTSRSRNGAELHTSTIINGGNWTARRIKNNNLRQHCKQLARSFRPGHPRNSHKQIRLLKDACLRLCQSIEVNSTLLEKGKIEDRWIEAIFRICAYQSKWIRQPETWSSANPQESAREQFIDLLNHLFNRYPIPKPLASAWLARGELISPERELYCEIAAGKSLRKTLQNRKSPAISAKAAHLISKAPIHYTFNQAIRFGQLAAVNAPPQLIEAVINSAICDDFKNDNIWQPLITMIISNQKDFDPTLLNSMIDYIRHEIYINGEFRLKGRTLKELQRTVIKSIAEMIHMAESYGHNYTQNKIMLDDRVREAVFRLTSKRWSIHPKISEPYEFQDHRSNWKIVELNTQQDLITEGKILHHCIATWGHRCQKGEFHIFSLRRWDEHKNIWDPHATLAVTPGGKIHEVRSVRNTYVNRREQRVIDQWIEFNATLLRN